MNPRYRKFERFGPRRIDSIDTNSCIIALVHFRSQSPETEKPCQLTTEPIKITDKRLLELVTDWRNRKPRSLRDNGFQGLVSRMKKSMRFPSYFPNLPVFSSRHVVFVASELYSTIDT